MISFDLDCFFWIDRFQFSFTYGAPLCAYALLKRRKSGKCKKYLFKPENTEKSIFLSDVIFKTFLTAFYIIKHDKWIKDWAFP